MRRALVVANWKMNTTVATALELVAQMKEPLCAIEGVEKVLCPPFTALTSIKELVAGTPIKLGGQNMYYREEGAFTGETSPLMLRELCQYVILGHSERRSLFGETDELVNKKVQAALQVGLHPIVCVGETLEQRDEGRAEEVVLASLQASLQGTRSPEHLVIAYEPVWAIGTGRCAGGGAAQAMMSAIRNFLGDLFSAGRTGDIPLLYGGSVSADNIHQFVSQESIDGALVGGASLHPQEFVAIVSQTAKARLSLI